ncbi:hypothetical protein [Metabacillus bambusae]|uniref:WYL domain-containing protein n=1 Tax=Metabacillus bambusae TaxID=2795218 RepID=A0ABS3N9V3_9BACI|nr:hypothetical protein [Metabacillus bambusae]MBO1515072.1 hypothetical protein [Metabacillus bambusae]
MTGLLFTSKEDQMPIELMYISGKGDITHRTVIVRDIQDDYIKAFCLTKQQPRLFKRSNILSAAKVRRYAKTAF